MNYKKIFIKKLLCSSSQIQYKAALNIFVSKRLFGMLITLLETKLDDESKKLFFKWQEYLI